MVDLTQMPPEHLELYQYLAALPQREEEAAEVLFLVETLVDQVAEHVALAESQVGLEIELLELLHQFQHKVMMVASALVVVDIEAVVAAVVQLTQE